jgi:hypothetical protein
MGERINPPEMHTIAAAGTQVTSGAASAQVAIPVRADGVKANYIRVVALASAYVKVGLTGLTATANDILVPAGTSIQLNVHGMTHIAYLQETAAAKLNFLPLEVA